MARDTTKLFSEILEIIIIVLALAWFSKTFLFGFAEVRDNDMLPTLKSNTQVFVDKGFQNHILHLKRGDILIYYTDDKIRNQKIKRLIGLPGDKVEIKNGFAYINGQPLYEPYTHTPVTYQFTAITVPENHYFVLNDNRGINNDSRQTGSISKENLIGKAVFSYWPWYQIKIL